MRRHYNSETLKLQLQSEMDSLELKSFMRRHKSSNHTERLAKLVDYIKILASQLLEGFGDDQHETQYLLRALMSYDRVQQPISQLITARYAFTPFMTSLNEILQLQEKFPLQEHQRATTVSILLIRENYDRMTAVSEISSSVIIRLALLTQKIGTRATLNPRIDTDAAIVLEVCLEEMRGIAAALREHKIQD